MRAPLVLFVAHVGQFGGSAVALGSLIEHLDPRIRKACAGSADGPVLASYLRTGKIDAAIPIRWRGLGAIAAIARLSIWSWRRREALSAIVANGTNDLLLALPAALVSRRPLHVWVHDHAPKSWPPRLAFLIRRCRVRWIAVSEFAASELVDTGLARPGEVEVVHNPVDPAGVAGLPHVSDPDLRIGYLGTETERKGFPLVAEIAERVSRPGVRWVLFTNRQGRRHPRILEAWKRLDALGPERVEIVGRVSDVREAYARCDIVFVPSLRESFGRIVAEALCNGLPVVASDLPPFREVLGSGCPAPLFPPGDADAAVQALRRVLGDESLRKELALAARARAASFAPDRIARRFEALFDALPRGDAREARGALDASGTLG